MENLKRLVRMSFALAIIALTGLIFSHLALTDIFHQNEPSLATEWNIVKFTFLFILIYITISSITIMKLRKSKH